MSTSSKCLIFLTQVWNVFRDVCRFWRLQSKNPMRLRRAGSDNKDPISPSSSDPSTSVVATTSSKLHHIISPNSLIPISCRQGGSSCILGRRWTEVEEEDEESNKGSNASSPMGDVGPFRGRACTDGHLQHRPWRFRYPPPNVSTITGDGHVYPRADRRMSISMRGNNASY